MASPRRVKAVTPFLFQKAKYNMADQRIKGQETTVIIVENGNPLNTIRDIQSMDMEAALEIISEGYLGETTLRKDEKYNGYSGSIGMHFSNPEILNLTRRIIDRARRRDPGLKINIQTTLQFPNGVRTRVILKDCFFGAIPMSFGGQGEYGSVTLPFEGSDFSVI